MKLKRLYGVLEDEKGDQYLVPLRINSTKKLNGRTLEVSTLLKIIEGVKKWTKGSKK